MARIEMKELRKVYGRGIEAVKRLDLDIEEGEFLVLVGPSGCGKTTTLRMIAGFEEPTAGEIYIDGRLVNDLEPGQRNLGMVFQNLALFPHKTVAENIEFGPRMKKVPPEVRGRRVREAAEMVRITHLLGKLPGQCSGGEAQRVALARTLVTEPGAFLLDEPLSSLDAKLRREMRAEIDRLHQRLKKTFIYVTHDQEEAMTLADRIVVMRNGLIEQVGSPMQIYGDPVSHFVADFFGSPSMNLIGGQVSHEGGRARFEAPGLAVELPPALARAAAGETTLGIRPEHLEISGNGGVFRGEVRLVEPLGKDTLLYFDRGGDQPLIAVVEGTRSYREGDVLNLSVDPGRLYLFGWDGKRVR
ncbi:MAG: ABC transporter ATP-binding protein [Candidatus Tectomicrobia bacterium]|uniref:ABC transporter ATP-binding protein n=1 Tax=Tectimicrobiota bacterium TaxID=2528274 RepID=A0A932HZG5_UNCTE|nr:ABC transporter ATP-binding protein [Candidatus Tectomicrobia bacterium]